jgi:hypothetical protein
MRRLVAFVKQHKLT